MIDEIPIYKEGIRFPVAKTLQGREYTGLDLLDKPHGYKDIMVSVLRELVNGPKKYKPIVKRYCKAYSQNDVETTIEIMLIGGLIKIQCTNKKPKKGETWEKTTIMLADAAATELTVADDDTSKVEKLTLEVNEIVGNITLPIVYEIKEWIKEGYIKRNDSIIATMRAWIKFRSVILALSWSAVFTILDKHEALRVVSQRIWGDSKKLDAYKGEIAVAGGDSLDGLRLTSRYESVSIYGDVDYQINKKIGSCLAGLPVMLSELTIRNMAISDVKATKIIIVENMAVFQEILEREYFSRDDAIVLWGEGYLSSTKRKLLKKVIKYQDLPVFIWSDIDVAGILLTYDIIRLIEELDGKAFPLMMSDSELSLTKGEFQGSMHGSLNKEQLRLIFGTVIDRVEAGEAMEQEELLIDYEYVASKLP